MAKDISHTGLADLRFGRSTEHQRFSAALSQYCDLQASEDSTSATVLRNVAAAIGSDGITVLSAEDPRAAELIISEEPPDNSSGQSSSGQQSDEGTPWFIRAQTWKDEHHFD